MNLFFKKTKKSPPRVLAIVNHYYGQTPGFRGKSSTQDHNIRLDIVNKVIKEIKNIPNIEIKICGIKNKSLLNIDIDFNYLTNPSFLIYESIEWMFTQLSKYDYFINIEDDILLTKDTFNRTVEFDQKNKITECLHPNRLEYQNEQEYCVDLQAIPEWTNYTKRYNEFDLRVAKNPHSGISILSKRKMLYAKKRINLKRRDIIIGHYMESAYANLHSPFLMYRTYPEISLHSVIHLDNWNPSL